MSNDLQSYEAYFEERRKQWENMCRRCGGCCGAYDDPCQHLKRNVQGLFYCEIYDRRFGERRSVGGEKFDCVPVREILHSHWKNDHLCAYKRYLQTPWL